VALVRTKVTEERIASIVRVPKIGELGTALEVTNDRSKQRRNIKREHSSETSVLAVATRRHIPEDCILNGSVPYSGEGKVTPTL
jgi:hypothetical protein